MIDKKDVKCIKKTLCGPFYDNYIIFIQNKYLQTNIHDLRIMNKPIIIKYEEENLIQYEYYIRIKLRNPFLVNILFAFQDYDNLYMIQEYANTNFFNFLALKKTFTRKAARFYICEIILAIEYLHSKQLSYGFFPSKNIFVNDKGHLKLRYDFLNAIIEKHGGARDFIEYTAPEYIKKATIRRSMDVWQIGILLYHMIVGYTPFGNETYEATRTAIMNQQEIIYPDFVDESTRDIINKILRKDLEDRISFEDMKRHDFFKGVDWDLVFKKEGQPPFFFNELDRYKNASPADLDKIYTSDYYPDQNKDGYGHVFRYWGCVDVLNPYDGDVAYLM